MKAAKILEGGRTRDGYLVMKQLFLLALAATALSTSAAAEAPGFGTFGIDVAGMDEKIRPGDDFYGYVNNGWMEKTEIPEDRSNYGTFSILDELSKERTRKILEEMKADPESLPGIAYRSYLDQQTVEEKGLQPIQPWLAEVRDVSRAKYPELVASANRAGIRTIFPSYVTQDDKEPDHYILVMWQGGIGMPDRDYYLLDTPKMEATRAHYLQHLEKMLSFAGEENVVERARAVFAFEQKLATSHWTRVESRDAEKVYNRRTLKELQKEAPGFDFKNMFKTEGTRAENILVAQPAAISAAAKAVAEAPLSVLQDQLLVRSLEAYADYLPDEVADTNFAFYGTELTGTPARQSRWKDAVDFAVGAVPDEVSKVYVARYFPPDTKAVVDELVANVVAAMERRIDKLDWMGAEAKEVAHKKLASFTTKIGYPDKWRDYSALQLKPDDLFGNAWRTNQFHFADGRAKLGTPIRRWEWFMTPMTINAYANFSMNEIVFPAAIIQPPFFDPKADMAVNYGGIGAVIGHEISHHFDDQGSKYDADGRLASWWSEEDRTAFKSLSDKLIAQYDAYEPLPGEHVQGALTLGENIGDLAGLAIAYDAYQASLGGKPAPVIDGVTGDQRFFMGWAQVWRRKHREADLRQRLLTDPHAPAQYRADIVRNFDAWYEAFGERAEGKLSLSPEDRVKIW